MIILANWKIGALYDGKTWRYNIDFNIINVVL